MKKIETPLRCGDILYHAEHGPCLIRKIEKADGLPDGGLCYHLVSKEKNAAANQFFVPVSLAEASGFHPPYSVTEGNKILSYLKKKSCVAEAPSSERAQLISDLVHQNTLWSFARLISIYCRDDQGGRGQGKYRVVARAGRGLVRELAYIFNISLKASVAKVCRNLRDGKIANRWVIETLNQLDEDAG